VKQYLVVGGTKGIGRAAVTRFVRSGAHVIFCGRDRESGEALVTERDAERSGCALFQPADIRIQRDVDVLFDVVARRFATLDGVFNCAGVIGRDTLAQGIAFHESEEDAFDSVFDVNVKGMWRCLRQELRIMAAQGSGAIVNCASVAGLRSADSRSVSYTASKHALVGMTRALAAQYAPLGIRVNAICPGVIDTDMLSGMREELLHDLRNKNAGARIGTPDEVASAAEFLLSDDSAYINGVALIIDAGGLTGAI